MSSVQKLHFALNEANLADYLEVAVQQGDEAGTASKNRDQARVRFRVLTEFWKVYSR